LKNRDSRLNPRLYRSRRIYLSGAGKALIRHTIARLRTELLLSHYTWMRGHPYHT